MVLELGPQVSIEPQSELVEQVHGSTITQEGFLFINQSVPCHSKFVFVGTNIQTHILQLLFFTDLQTAPLFPHITLVVIPLSTRYHSDQTPRA
jgi:hypothetical protein